MRKKILGWGLLAAFVLTAGAGLVLRQQFYGNAVVTERDLYVSARAEYGQVADSLLRIENPNSATERRLIVLRDSFAASLIPLLAESYREITLIDIRYLSPASLGKFVDFDAQDVLFLYSTSVLNDSSTIK